MKPNMITSKQTNGRKPKASFSETVRNNQMKFRFSSNSLDIIVKVAGILTIFIPLLLFYKQQEAENTRNWTEKKRMNIPTYWYRFISWKNSAFSKAFEEAHNTIFYEVYPRLLIFNDKEILNKVDSLRSLDVFLLQSKDVLEKLNETDSLAIVLLDSAGLNTEQYSSLYYRLGMPSLFYYFKGTSESFTKQYADNSNEFIKNIRGNWILCLAATAKSCSRWKIMRRYKGSILRQQQITSLTTVPFRVGHVGRRQG